MSGLLCFLVTISNWIESHSGEMTVIATAFIAGFTWALARSTKKLWQETKTASEIAGKSATASLKMSESLVLAERAYVKMSHRPPGLASIDLDTEMAKSRKGYGITIRVKNSGRTPATITDVVLTHRVLDIDDILPLNPEYDRDRGAAGVFAFLVTNDQFFWNKKILIKREQLPDIEHHRKKLIIYGYVDYFDQFHQPHRAGYARQCDPDSPTRGPTGWSEIQGFSRLPFVDQDGYNYDRPRNPDEGQQWKEPPKKPQA